ncbi:N-acetylmuramoyl-L-alanine amidase CwlD [Evansella cellulosilytica]|uniref:N-acetylmuramoyl-L-alanine amidase CwlD n=1 Tax=Evansella cellulosilytica (strain ATCC 21833 / DSM 2522 / FERM P-1141 / JCM 9156 / N-4) TaxID=649639 RepID=E6TTB0_EVAC2|nr:N-acetylmuramoyl-L-alanine amidase CwlD [Evansella cellulosilytica]ADU28450.1 N-acetylmuramoyl-L-alanine amidase CwlD [Evansella cellulosilytica DSM 2522]
MRRSKLIKIVAIALALGLLIVVIQIQLSSKNSTGWHLPLSGQVIVIDPGHGGIDGGASSKAGDLEKDITLQISFKLRDYLQESGALVLMTREGDHDLASDSTSRVRSRKAEDLRKRVSLINDSNADLFVSIHLNSIPSPKWRGAQTFYNRAVEGNEELSKHIQGELRRNLENTTREAKPINSVYILQQANVTGSLVEVGFLSNPSEAELLSTKDYQQKVAASIYEGILRHASGDPLPSS